MFPFLADRMSQFEARLAEELRSEVAFIEAIGEDLAGAGGKRLRPTLSFLAADLVGADAETGMAVALAVELLHSASLLHDDLIDDAQTRRGHQAAFRRYGNVVSVVSGDFMLAKVLGLLAQTDSPDFTRLMSRTATRICEGEVLQFQSAVLESHDLHSYRQVIEGKTAVLLAAALEGPALVAGAPETQREALRRFGMAYGRAFQMQDDRLDLLGDPALLGKPVGGDLREGKATYPVLLLIEDGETEPALVLRRRASEPGDVERLSELLRSSRADERTRQAIADEVEEAVAALHVFPASDARASLIHLARLEIDRER